MGWSSVILPAGYAWLLREFVRDVLIGRTLASLRMRVLAPVRTSPSASRRATGYLAPMPTMFIAIAGLSEWASVK
jgi:hypothetical protein